MGVKTSESWLFANALSDQNNGTMGAEPRLRSTLTRRNKHLLINSWFLSDYQMKFNDIFHKYNKNGAKRLNTLGHLDQYMAQHGRIVKQSYCETV